MSSHSHITWQTGRVTREDRRRIQGHGGATLWFTGLSGSGKTTIGRRVEEALCERGWLAYVLDGDNIRHGLSSDLGFGAVDRGEHIRRAGEVAKLFTDAGVLVICAFISPYREDRQRVRALFAPGDFIEIYVKAPLELCEQRDPRGLYRKARAGEIGGFTGIDAPYEEPRSPEIVLDTEGDDLEASVDKVLRYLQQAGVIPAERT